MSNLKIPRPERLRQIALYSILVLFLAFTAYVTLYGNQKDQYNGDAASGGEVWKSGLNFHRFGFSTLRYAPIQASAYSAREDLPLDKPEMFYTHYPSGADFAQGLLFNLGLSSMLSHQMAALLISILGLWFAWRALTVLFNPASRLASFAVYVLSPSTIYFANTIYIAPYFILFDWCYLYWVLTLPEARKHLAWVKFFLLALVASWFSFDEIPQFLSIGFLIPLVLWKQKNWSQKLLLFGAAPLGWLIGMGLHLYRNSLVFGSFSAAFNDILHAFLVRSNSQSAKIEGTYLAYDFAKHVAKFVFGLQWFFTLPLVALAVVGWLLVVRTKGHLVLKGLFFVTTLGGFFWQFFMKQHGVFHAFTYRHPDLFVALGVGSFAHLARGKARDAVVAIAMIILLSHSALSTLSIEGTALKRVAIQALLSQSEEPGWACIQAPRIANSTQLSGGKQIVAELIPDASSGGCDSVTLPAGLATKIKSNLAAFVLFLR